MVWQALTWYVWVALIGVLSVGSLRRLGLGTGVAWAVARVFGAVVGGYCAWIGGWLGISHWWWLGLVPLAFLAGWGRRFWRDIRPVSFVWAELVGLVTFILLAWLRWPGMAIIGTEKPMDLAILSTLLRPGTIPPVDPWLAGMSLPYYYWGFVPWLLSAKATMFSPDVIYNLLVPTIALVSAQAAWALARTLGGSQRSAVFAAFLVVFGGTLDGWRQMATGVGVSALNVWESSRQITGTITEFPLFTFHLGDLHPHLLATPLILVCLVFARGLAKSSSIHRGRTLATALTFGAAAAANPWCALPLGLAVLFLCLAREDGFVGFSDGPGWRSWVMAVGVGLAGWVLFLPFWLNFHPPTKGIGFVTTPTRPDQLVLLLGSVLLCTLFVASELVWRWGGIDPARRQFARVCWLTGVAVLALGAHVVAGALVFASAIAVVIARKRVKNRVGRIALLFGFGPMYVLIFVAGIEVISQLGGVRLPGLGLADSIWRGCEAALGPASQRLALALAVGCSLALITVVVTGRHRQVRPVLALNVIALLLLGMMELVFIRDPYGAEFYRMNTVFKATHLIFLLMAVTTPVMLGWLRRRRPVVAVSLAVFVILTCLPQISALAIRASQAEKPEDWGGLGWMVPGESDAVRWLRSQPAGSVIIEGVGEAYSEAGRMSGASGVPTILGWENHELVWRGDEVRAEVAQRRLTIQDLYTCGKPQRVREIAQQLGASVVVIGSVEHRVYDGGGFAAVREAGEVVLSDGGCTVVSITGGKVKPAGNGPKS